MASPRHRKSVPGSVRARRIAFPVTAVLVLVPGLAGAVAPSGDREATSARAGAMSADLSGRVATRAEVTDVSRAGERGRVSRVPLVGQPGDRVDPDDPGEQADPAKQPDVNPVTRWLTADLNVWSGLGENNRLLTVLPERSTVRATRLVRGVWAQIEHADRHAWVRAAYLVATRPPKEDPASTERTAADGGGDAGGSGTDSVSAATCPDGSTVESGLTTNAVVVYRAVCASFPAVSSWGGLRPGDDGDHGTGHALDIMVGSDSALGEAIAAYVQANHSELGVSEIIWSQHIWTVQRGSEGWRPMEDRGSTTANHYDHVHVSVY